MSQSCAGNCHCSSRAAEIEELCWQSHDRDLLAMLETTRISLNLGDCGPAFHALVPAIIMACYRNSGGEVERSTMHEAITRGITVQEGWCGIAGACGAGLGVGLAFSALVESEPTRGQGRLNVMQVTTEVLRSLCTGPDVRCCLRETYLSLCAAARLSDSYLPIVLTARGVVGCSLHLEASECLRIECALYRAEL